MRLSLIFFVMLATLGCRAATKGGSAVKDSEDFTCSGAYSCRATLYQVSDHGDLVSPEPIVGCGNTCQEAAKNANTQCENATRQFAGNGKCEEANCPSAACVQTGGQPAAN